MSSFSFKPNAVRNGDLLNHATQLEVCISPEQHAFIYRSLDLGAVQDSGPEPAPSLNRVPRTSKIHIFRHVIVIYLFGFSVSSFSQATFPGLAEGIQFARLSIWSGKAIFGSNQKDHSFPNVGTVSNRSVSVTRVVNDEGPSRGLIKWA